MRCRPSFVNGFLRKHRVNVECFSCKESVPYEGQHARTISWCRAQMTLAPDVAILLPGHKRGRVSETRVTLRDGSAFRDVSTLPAFAARQSASKKRQKFTYFSLLQRCTLLAQLFQSFAPASISAKKTKTIPSPPARRLLHPPRTSNANSHCNPWSRCCPSALHYSLPPPPQNRSSPPAPGDSAPANATTSAITFLVPQPACCFQAVGS